MSVLDQLGFMSSETEYLTVSSGSRSTASNPWWDKKINMCWKLKERMQRMDDLGAEVSQMLVESLLAINDGGNEEMKKKFHDFLWFMWLPMASGDRVMTWKVLSLLRVGNNFLAELQKTKKGKDESLKKPLTLPEREFQELLDGLNGGLHKIQWILAFVKDSMSEADEDSLENLDSRLEECKKSLEELQTKIAGLKKSSQLFSEFSSEIEEFMKGEMEEEMSRLWNTTWDLEDEAVGNYIVWSPHAVRFI